jgi:antitoxin CcdA
MRMDQPSSKPRKKAVNLSVDAEILDHARKMGLNLSHEFERCLKERTKAERWAKWQEENQEAIDAYNRRIERRGLFSDGHRRF